MKPWLHVGAKVVCVDDGFAFPAIYCVETPQIGPVYTIRAIFAGSFMTRGPGLAVHLEEIHNREHHIDGRGWGEVGFAADRFRPVLPDTSKQVEALRSLMLDAAVRGKVSA